MALTNQRGEGVGIGRKGVAVVVAALLTAGGAARPEATVLLPADTNRAAVRAFELDYDPAAPRLRVAVTVSGGFIKRGEVTDRGAIQSVLEVLRFQKSRELFITFEENRLLTFFVQTR